MIITRKLIAYLDGRLEELTEEDIKHYKLMVYIHRPMLVKIDGPDVTKGEIITSKINEKNC